MSDSHVDEKLDKIVEHIGNIDITLAKQSVQLESHIKRTEIAEQNIDMLRKDFKPVEKHVMMVSGALKLVGALALVASIVEGSVMLLEWLGIKG